MFPRNRHFLQSAFAPMMGIPFVLFTMGSLWFNEGRAVKTSRALAEGAKSVRMADCRAVSPDNEGKLVYLTGEVTTGSTVRDAEFHAEATALRLNRQVVMYQWQESESSSSSGSGREQTKTYSYRKVWSDKPISSAGFHQSGHENPRDWPFESKEWRVSDARMSAYRIPERILGRLGGAVRLTAPLDQNQTHAQGSARPAPMPYMGGMFFGKNPDDPQVGDMCVSFLQLKPGTFSLISQQVRDSLQPYRAASGVDVELVGTGNVEVPALFDTAVRENDATMWLIRIFGFIFLTIGMVFTSHPIGRFGARIPVLGHLIGAGVAIFAIGMAIVCWITVIALAWLAYRSVLTFTLLLGVAALILWATKGMKAIGSRESGGSGVKTA